MSDYRPVDYAKLDKYGLHKVSVMVSANGKVFGLDVANGGQILWSNYLAPTVAASSSAVATGKYSVTRASKL